MTPLRQLAALLAALALVGLATWSVEPGKVEGPARVEAGTEFRVVHAGDGVLRWSLLDGTIPGGPVVVADGVLQGERGDLVQVERLGELQPGAPVAAGAPLLRMDSSRLAEDAAALAAEAEALAAEEALLRAGGRPESVARARQAVEVAAAQVEVARATAAHLEGLVARGAEAAWVAEEARRQLAVDEAALALARAALAEERLEPREAELDAVRARRAAAQARLAGAQGRSEGVRLASPIAGRLALPGADTLVSVQGDGPPVLQVAVDEAWRARLAPGAPIRFEATARPDRPVGGRVLAVGEVAAALGGQPVVWVVASLDEPVPVGATGTARVDVGAGAP